MGSHGIEPIDLQLVLLWKHCNVVIVIIFAKVTL